jgi:lactate permease
LSEVFGPLYLVVAPILGALGAFVSGSNTVSNMLFTAPQLEKCYGFGVADGFGFSFAVRRREFWEYCGGE